ncbi:type II toxin-antitoxin system RelE/ParE family toxin [Rhizobium leguminosarum]|uniref:type II toxin-antitoxin system RelE/ParE family toxin n=1 Tax=Rhizobium leguminosarum TaxID=384 RepID=UPI00103090A1|nr:type II toxin-antitoxin system RelE/ParE family toxin [Rhizobium leguminosarum]TBG52591.1 type II toxin-antitoxin system RelE/ParE family toxin [Rhizobium leguminosarum]
MTNKLILKYVNNSALKAMRDLPKEVGLQFATDLQRVQNGKNPLSDFKHLTGMGSGVIELIENGSPAYRVVYCAKHNDTLYVLHAFTKTTNGVDKAAMETVKGRIKLMMADVRSNK